MREAEQGRTRGIDNVYTDGLRGSIEMTVALLLRVGLRRVRGEEAMLCASLHAETIRASIG